MREGMGQPGQRLLRMENWTGTTHLDYFEIYFCLLYLCFKCQWMRCTLTPCMVHTHNII